MFFQIYSYKRNILMRLRKINRINVEQIFVNFLIFISEIGPEPGGSMEEFGGGNLQECIISTKI